MNASNQSNISNSPQENLAGEIIKLLQAATSESEFLATLLGRFREYFAIESIGLIRQRDGQWQVIAWEGDDEAFCDDLVPKALDCGALVHQKPWLAVPLTSPTSLPSTTSAAFIPAEAYLGNALVMKTSSSAWNQAPNFFSQIETASVWLSAAIEQFRGAIQSSRRLNQLTAVLQAAADWQRLEDDQSLLEGIASTATELLQCERASIFLWDRRRKKLVGRPALGVPGGVLEVDDSVGVVGEVLQSSAAKIWNRGNDEETRVNRKVDQSLEFETQSLLAVPMFGQRDQLIGVFEAINHADGRFQDGDTKLLCDLATHASVAIESQKVRKDLTATRDRLVEDAASRSPLIGEHPSMQAIRATAIKVAKTDLGVLIRGGNGTGKEVLARCVHFESTRRSGPFIAVNCAALVETLLESELFGHEKGSFTDAQTTRVGKFELADQGTLFLDEVGDMSPGGQAKLLRVLEEKVVVRVGGSQTIPVDVRVIAATNQPLEELIRQKLFREDLFFRLNVVNLSLPCLSDRGEDVLILADHFLNQFCSQIGRPVPTFEPTARQTLLSHAWPGNIRELRNTIERVAYLCDDDRIEVDDLMLGTSGMLDSQPKIAYEGSLNDATREFQIEHIRRTIEVCEGKMTEAARYLGLHRSNLYRKMHQLGMQVTED